MFYQDAKYHAETWDIMQLLFKAYNDHQLRAVISFQDSLDEQRLEQAVALTADIVPVIKSRFVEHMLQAYWEPIPAGRFVSLCTTDDPEREINRFITETIDEHIGQQLKIKIVRGPISDTICVLLNHMVSDAAGFKEYLYLLSEIYAALLKNPELKPHYNICGDRSMGQIFHASGGLLKRLKILMAPDGMSKHDCGFQFSFEGDHANPFIITLRLPRDRVQAIKAYGKIYGATLNDVILAAYIRALKCFLQLDDCRLVVPCAIDLRKYMSQHRARSICNLTSTIACEIKLRFT